MSTYRQKIEEYKRRIEVDQSVGKDPSTYDLTKLKYYSGKAERRGLDAEISMWSKGKSTAKATAKSVFSPADVAKLLAEAARILMTKQ